MIFKSRFFLYLIFVLCFLSMQSNLAQADYATTGRVEHMAAPLFQTPIPAPSMVKICEGLAWAYSVSLHELWALDLQSGKVLGKFSLMSILPEQHVTAMTCTKSSFVLGTIQKEVGTERLKFPLFSLYKINIPKVGASLSGLEKLAAPEKSLVRDLQFSGNSFLLVQDSVFESANLTDWKKLELAASKSVLPKGVDLTANPFSDWQESFFVSDGQYTKLKMAADGTMIALDPLRAHVVFFGKGGNYRWGRWGTRNGSMMFAKSFAVVLDKWIAITDVGLKLVFIFDFDGNYVGYLGSNGEQERFGYPLDIAANGETLYVADFFENHITALKINQGSMSVSQNRKPEDRLKGSFSENNLFANPAPQKSYAMVRCLNCHDGLEKYSLEKFILAKKHHPLGVVPKLPIDLPLGEDNKMSCFTCHQNHHQSLSAVVTGDFGEQKVLDKAPFMLRKPFTELCLTCHKDKEATDQSHLGLSSTKLQKFRIQVKSCSQCHALHSAEPRQLRKTVSEMCMTCHTQARKPKSHPFGTQKDDSQLTCISCHGVHGGNKSAHFARKKGKDSEGACLECHKNKIPLLGQNKHLTVDPKKKVAWNLEESPCLSCHSPHEKKNISDTCLSCHQNKKIRRHDKNVVAVFKLAGVELPQKIILSDGKLTCATCHDPHAASSQTKLLRPRASVLPVCATMCHSGEDAELRFSQFHSEQGKAQKALKGK